MFKKLIGVYNTMAKKPQKMKRIELLDTFIPIFAVCWALVFAYIAVFNESNVLALITVMPIFILYGLYIIGSAIYCYKELEILKALGKDYYEVEKQYRKKAPKLSTPKLVTGGICIVIGILWCIFL